MNASDENQLVLSLLQAMLGSISSNFRAVFLNGKESSVELHFVIERESSEDREEIEDIVFEFEALLLRNMDVSFKVYVGMSPLAELQVPGRMVYGRKE